MTIELSDAQIKGIENEIRDTINLLAVFEKEYDLPIEVTERLRERLESVAKRIGKAL